MLFMIFPLAICLYLFFSFRRVIPGIRGSIFAAAVIVLFFAGFFLRESFVGTVLEAVFTVWLAESLMLFLVWDLGRIFRRILWRKPLQKKTALVGNRIVLAAGTLLTIVFFAVGVPNNYHYRIRELVVEVPKLSQPFSAVFFSDLHVDPLFFRSKLERLSAEVDSISPDYVLFGGDLADVHDSWLRERNYDSLFGQISSKAKLGAFGINGNHEGFMESAGSDPEGWMRQNGMIVLDDSTACTELACFTGRTDFAVARSRGIERKPLSELRPDSGKPWILMDHQPKGIEPEYSGPRPDLALSGHTHDGQFFPATAFIGFFWRLAAGFGTLDQTPWLVSTGIDSWGPPVRVGSKTDMWVIRFEPKPGQRE